MTTPGSGRIEDLLGAHVAAGDFPGASYLVAEADRVIAEGAVGRAVLVPEVIPARSDTLYDLASLTKPLAGALLAVLFESEGRWSLDDPLARHLPEWTPTDARASITLRDLLTHRSGLPAWKPLYLYATDRPQRIEWLARHAPLERPPGRGVAYSCPGYILLGLALERVAQRPLDRLFGERVAAPLGLDGVLFRPPAALRPRIAATESGNARERSLAGPDGEGYNGWRTEVIWGEVHDHNACTLEGRSANAGLFGTARAVHAVALEILGAGKGLVPAGLRPVFGINATPGLQEDRSVGFQLASTSGSSAGPGLAATSAGHTGFTGTSLWIDFAARRIYVLLTNRVHPHFRDLEMNAIRRAFHEVAAAL